MKLKDLVELMNEEDFFELSIDGVHNRTSYYKGKDYSEYENYEIKEVCVWDDQTLKICI